MRIIGGEYKGRILRMPKGVAIRPTQDRVREALFNVIRECIPGSSVLDLYAGSGAFGIEALSRGASFAIFVDNNTKCIRTIKSNLSQIGIKGPVAKVIKADAYSALVKLKKSNISLDVVFLDPPYHRGLGKNSLIKLDAYDIVTPLGFVITEHFLKDDMPEEVGYLRLIKRKKYGDTILSYYRRIDTPQEQ